MEVTLYDGRVRLGEPGSHTCLGEMTSMSLSASGFLRIETDLAYRLGIELNMDELRNQLAKIDAKKQAAAERRKAKRAKTETVEPHEATP